MQKRKTGCGCPYTFNMADAGTSGQKRFEIIFNVEFLVVVAAEGCS
jgi:hypothetical protein